MPQDVGVGPDSGGTVRELLLEAAPARVARRRRAHARRRARAGGRRRSRRRRDAPRRGDRRLVRAGRLRARGPVGRGLPPDRARRRSTTSAARSTTQLSGGERKQLVLEVLFSSDAAVLLLDEPDNFLDVPAKLALEARIAASQEDRRPDQPRPRPARRGDERDPHARGERDAGSTAARTAPTPRRARSASSCSATGWSSGSARSGACSSTTRS